MTTLLAQSRSNYSCSSYGESEYGECPDDTVNQSGAGATSDDASNGDSGSTGVGSGSNDGSGGSNSNDTTQTGNDTPTSSDDASSNDDQLTAGTSQDTNSASQESNPLANMDYGIILLLALIGAIIIATIIYIIKRRKHDTKESETPPFNFPQ